LASEKLQFAGFAPVRNDSKEREFVLEEAKRVTSFPLRNCDGSLSATVNS
jgi:hypothetical protein